MICRVAGELLASAGFDVLEASDGEWALKLAHEEHPALIVLDLMMPNVSGYQVVREIRQHPRLKGIPILILSGVVPGKEANDPLRGYGISGFISKASMVRSLVPRVQAILSKTGEQTTESGAA
jgi:DNA-binding response OmpR family regulator